MYKLFEGEEVRSRVADMLGTACGYCSFPISCQVSGDGVRLAAAAKRPAVSSFCMHSTAQYSTA
jgi:hypothetical protein